VKYKFSFREWVVHAYYVDVSWSECKGYRPKPHIKRKWLSPLVRDSEKGNKEIIESVKKGLLIITELKVERE